MGTEFQFCKLKMFWMAVTVAQQCTEYHGTEHLSQNSKFYGMHILHNKNIFKLGAYKLNIGSCLQAHHQGDHTIIFSELLCSRGDDVLQTSSPFFLSHVKEKVSCWC